MKTALAAVEELAERDKEFSPSIRSLTKRLIRERDRQGRAAHRWTQSG